MMKASYKIAGVLLLSLTAIQTAVPTFAAEDQEYSSTGVVEFVPYDGQTDPLDPNDPDSDNPVNPWDPNDPDNEPDEGTNGPLSLDYASSIDFGKNKISNKDEIYYAEPQYMWNTDHTEMDSSSARPAYVQVSDNRGTNAGWSLSVKQENQLSNDSTLNKELTGAQISFMDSEAVSNMEGVTSPKTFDFDLTPGAGSNVMNASKDTGAGTWIDRFGSIQEMEIEGENIWKDTSITLSIPGETPKDAVQYSTTLTWILADTPLNQ